MMEPTVGLAESLTAWHWDIYEDGDGQNWRWDELRGRWERVCVGDVCRRGDDRLGFVRWTGSGWSVVSLAPGALVLVTARPDGVVMEEELCRLERVVTKGNGCLFGEVLRRNDMGGQVVEVALECVVPVVGPFEFAQR